LIRRSSLELSREDRDGTTVLGLAGILDLATSAEVEHAVGDALDEGQGVTLELSELSMCDSTGLGALVRLYRQAAAAGLSFRLRDPRPHVADLLAMTGIDKVIPVDRSGPHEPQGVAR
jgi:anti-sigma B factor antagonist